jgi:hypothetical protein
MDAIMRCAKCYARLSECGCAPVPSGIHPAPAEFSLDECKTDDVLTFFHYAHLPEGALRDTSSKFCQLARWLVDNTPRCPQRTIALNNLLAAKDAAVRTNVRR